MKCCCYMGELILKEQIRENSLKLLLLSLLVLTLITSAILLVLLVKVGILVPCSKEITRSANNR